MVINEAELVRMKTHLAQINDPRREWGNLGINWWTYWSLPYARLSLGKTNLR